MNISVMAGFQHILRNSEDIELSSAFSKSFSILDASIFFGCYFQALFPGDSAVEFPPKDPKAMAGQWPGGPVGRCSPYNASGPVASSTKPISCVSS